jgi:hypothetical protein
MRVADFLLFSDTEKSVETDARLSSSSMALSPENRNKIDKNNKMVKVGKNT